VSAGGVVQLVGVVVALAVAIDARLYARRQAKKDEPIRLDMLKAMNRLAESAERREVSRTVRPGVEYLEADGAEWQIENPAKDRYVLRNLGTLAGRGVKVDAARIFAMHRDLPDGVDIPAGGSHSFLMIPSWGNPVPDEVWLSWDASPEGVAVPVPRWF
jgi:hypothetical protein